LKLVDSKKLVSNKNKVFTVYSVDLFLEDGYKSLISRQLAD